MNSFPKNHWEFLPSRMVFFSVESNQKPEAASETTPEAEAKSATSSLRTPKEAWSELEKAYGPTSYAAAIDAQVTKLMPATSTGYAETLKKQLTNDYGLFFTRTEITFYEESEKLNKAYRQAERATIKETKKGLSALKNALEADNKLTTFNESLPSYSQKAKLNQYFGKYVDVLSERYFNADMDYGKDSEYKALSGKLEEDTATYVQGRVNYLADKEASPAEFNKLKDEISGLYVSYSKMANVDNTEAVVSIQDLSRIYKTPETGPAIEKILNMTGDEPIKYLEYLSVTQGAAYKQGVEVTSKEITRQAVNDGAEEEFVATVSKEIESVDNFKQAKRVFRKEMRKTARGGARPTNELINKFTGTLFEDTMRFERKIEPAALSYQVGRQLDYLMSGDLIPSKETDRMLVKFMTGSRKTRNEMLSNPASRQLLFRGIQAATKSYPGVFNKRYGNIPTEAKKLRRSKNIAKPTSHDKAAQLKALIILGEQSKAILKKYDPTGENIITELEASPIPSDKSIRTGLKFNTPKLNPTQMRSALVRGGFNTRDLALKGAKILGVLTVASNMASAYNEAKGEDFLDRIMNAAEIAATNSALLAGAGVAVAAHLAERNPTFLKWPWLSQYDKDGAMAGVKLDNLGKKTTPEHRGRLLGNVAEWRVLDRMSAAQIKSLMKKANENRKDGGNALISAQMMIEAGILNKDTDKSTILALNEAHVNRTRYLFYEKFFSSKDKPDVAYVKELCTGSGYIAEDPSK